MTDRPFDPGDPSTWAATLTLDQVAAIYQRSPGGMRRACERRVFVPAPYARRPYRWRKTEVLQDVDPPQQRFPKSVLRRVVAADRKAG